jgi:hypothetical protein
VVLGVVVRVESSMVGKRLRCDSIEQFLMLEGIAVLCGSGGVNFYYERLFTVERLGP